MPSNHEYTYLSSANIERDAHWNPDHKLTLMFRGLELGGEVGEALNVIKKIEREKLGLTGSRATLEQLGEELADVVICAYLVAMEAGINLDRAIPKKFNKTSRERGIPVFMKEEN